HNTADKNSRRFTNLLRGDPARAGFELLQEHAFGKQFRKDDRFLVLPGIKHIERHTRPTKVLQYSCDHRIAVGPISFQFHDCVTLKGLSYLGALKPTGLIELAGETPRRREIDKNKTALLQFSLQPFGRKRLPIPSESRVSGSNVRGMKFVPDEINAAGEHEHEHKHERNTSLRR